MRLLNKIKTFAFITLLAAFAQPTIAQDLLARQAPVDRKMKAVDTLLLHKKIWNLQQLSYITNGTIVMPIDRQHFPIALGLILGISACPRRAV